MPIKIENHLFISHISYGLICKYCNIWTVEYFKRNDLIYDTYKMFPDCISDEEKLIKDIIE